MIKRSFQSRQRKAGGRARRFDGFELVCACARTRSRPSYAIAPSGAVVYSLRSSVDYQPVSRRPIADAFRKTAHGAVRLCVRLNIHPDTISYLSVVASAIAAACFWQGAARPELLLVGPLFCYLRLWFNMLDGMVALASGKASWRGEILNDLPDRVSDIVVFVGVAHSGLCSPFAGYWAALMAVLTAYVGMFGQAVGVQREFSGVMAKPWRMVTLHIGAWITFALLWGKAGGLRMSTPTVLDWTCLVVIAGCVQTIGVRLKRIMSALERKTRG
jgi:phosphatidylglycerophosphate synthase